MNSAMEFLSGQVVTTRWWLLLSGICGVIIGIQMVALLVFLLLMKLVKVARR